MIMPASLFIDPPDLADAVDRMTRAADPRMWSEPVASGGSVDVGQDEATATLATLADLIGIVPVAFFDQLSLVAAAADEGARDSITADTPIVDASPMAAPQTGDHSEVFISSGSAAPQAGPR